MRILVVGSGGREHALAWKLSQEATVFATPGNPGIADLCETFNVQPNDAVGLSALATRIGVDLIVIGPEDPLIAGVADHLAKDGHSVFGPTRDGARLEGSKAFAKERMSEAGVPTAPYQSFVDPMAALEYASSRFSEGKQVAVKASGAALGKGVVVCAEPSQAQDAIGMMMVDRALGPAGETVVIEDRLIGKEFSLIALVSGPDFWCLPPVQDYKRIHDGDSGPNTGGMGSYSPVQWVSHNVLRQAENDVIAPMVRLLAEKKIDFRGALFAGLMVQGDRPYCLEYNVRFGDPETQTLVRRLGSGFAESLRSAASGQKIYPPEVNDEAAVTVVMASAGYPGQVKKGIPISISPMPDGVVAFHAGTTTDDDILSTSGGRVLALSASAPTIEQARYLAYQGVERVRFEGMQYRKDIGK